MSMLITAWWVIFVGGNIRDKQARQNHFVTVALATVRNRDRNATYAHMYSGFRLRSNFVY